MAQTTPSYGGQAVIEGVVMRGPQNVSLAVRKPDGEIAAMVKRSPAPSQKNALFRVPVIRGALSFWDSLSLGIEMLIKSAEIAAPEEETPSKAAINAGVALGAAIAVGLFIMLPAVVTPYLLRVVSIESRVLSTTVETLVRFAILLGYVAVAFRMPEIQSVVEYHGAEHKTIWAWERNHREVLDKVRNESWDATQVVEYLSGKAEHEARLHPRCGTSFLFIVVLCTWVVFLFVSPPSIYAKVAIRLALLPFAAGLSYEVLKMSADKDNLFWRMLRAPGMALQSLTTREPSRAQLEVAAVSLVRLIEAEQVFFR